MLCELESQHWNASLTLVTVGHFLSLSQFGTLGQCPVHGDQTMQAAGVIALAKVVA